MSKIKFIHTADLHLDTPFKGLSDIPINIYKKIQQSTLQAYDKIIELCIDNKVDFLLIAGDTFDLDKVSLTAQIHFHKGLKKLNAYGIKVYIILGNHDSFEQKNTYINWPDNTHFFSHEKVESISFYKKDLEVARIYGRSYPTKRFNENIVKDYYFDNKSDKDIFKIALLHTNVDGIYENDSYAPSSLKDLKSTDVNYWALGHIHSAQILSEKNPVIIYPGNPQGRNIKETGLKSCTLVEVNNSNTISLKTLPTSLILWEHISINITEANTIDDVISIIENELYDVLENSKIPIIARLTLTGLTSLNIELNSDGISAEIKEIVNSSFNQYVKWALIESVIIKTKSNISYNEILNQENFIADYLNQLEKFNNGEIEEIDYQEICSELYKNRNIKKHLPIFNEVDLDEINEQIKNIAINYLLEEEK